MLRLGVDAGAVNAAGHSLLHKAAIYGRRDVCELLLEGPGGRRYLSRGGRDGEDGKDVEISHGEFKSGGGEVLDAVEEQGASTEERSHVGSGGRGDEEWRAGLSSIVGLPLGRAHTRPDLRNQQPSEMARFVSSHGRGGGLLTPCVVLPICLQSYGRPLMMHLAWCCSAALGTTALGSSRCTYATWRTRCGTPRWSGGPRRTTPEH